MRIDKLSNILSTAEDIKEVVNSFEELKRENEKLKERVEELGRLLDEARDAANYNSKLVSDERMKNTTYRKEGEAAAYRYIVTYFMEMLMNKRDEE